ncbi:hypothetical protein AAG906_000249 [Vitis piasezkii]
MYYGRPRSEQIALYNAREEATRCASSWKFYLGFFPFLLHLCGILFGFGSGFVMGALDHVSHLFDCSHGRSKLKRRKQLQTVEIKVKMDCEGCERKVRRAVEGMKGVTQVDVVPKHHKLTVVGYVDPAKVVARVAHRTGKKAELWPYVPYDVKAPPGYVRNAYEDPQYSHLARASSTEVRYTTAFSDENPAACAIM